MHGRKSGMPKNMQLHQIVHMYECPVPAFGGNTGLICSLLLENIEHNVRRSRNGNNNSSIGGGGGGGGGGGVDQVDSKDNKRTIINNQHEEDSEMEEA